MDLNDNEMLYRPSSLWIRSLIWAIIGSFSFGFIYACIARMDEVVIAKGELQALGAERPIRAPISGIVSEIYIKEKLITKHIDYWDTGRNFYSHLPVIGSIFRGIHK